MLPMSSSENYTQKLYEWNFDAQGNNQWHSEFVFELQPPNLFDLSNVVSDGDGNIIVNSMGTA